MNTEFMNTENPSMGMKPLSSRRPLQRISVNNSPKVPTKKRPIDGNVSVTLLYPGYFFAREYFRSEPRKMKKIDDGYSERLWFLATDFPRG